MGDNNTVDLTVEIEVLAQLDPIAYDRARAAAVERLDVRASTLDAEVRKKRHELGLDSEDDDGQGRAVRILDVMPWDESIDGGMLATMLACVVKNYVVLSAEAADAIALWVLHTWVIDKVAISPRLAITSPTKSCGKTTVLRLLNHLCRRPKRTGSVSPPALFRAVEKFQPTILLDETEKYIEHGGDLHALLNEGHAKGGAVWRVLGENLDLREFALFCAVAFARNGKLPDDLEQRSIVIEMQRRRPDESVNELRDDESDQLRELTRKCARWADDNADLVADSNPDMGDLINRDRDNWKGLFAIADLCGDDWPDRARDAAAILAPRENQSIGVLLLVDIKSLFDSKAADSFFSEALCEALSALEGRPWAEYGKARKPISKNQLARMLGDFKVIPGTVRQGTKTLKGYYRNQFDEVWQRYLASPHPHKTSQRHIATAPSTSTPSETSQRNVTPIAQNVTCDGSAVNVTDDVTFRNSEKPLRPNDCDVVTFDTGMPSKANRGNATDAGLSWRAIANLGEQIEDWAHERSITGDGDTDEDQLRGEINRVLHDAGVLEESIEYETDRILDYIFEAKEVGRVSAP